MSFAGLITIDYDGKTIAIQKLLSKQTSGKDRFQNAVILSDFKSAREAISKANSNETVTFLNVIQNLQNMKKK